METRVSLKYFVNGCNSKKEMKIDSSEEISTDLLNENDTQQSPSYSIKRNEDYLMRMPF